MAYLQQSQRDNPYYIPCSLKSILLLLLAPLYLIATVLLILKRLFAKYSISSVSPE